ncbi:heparinase II/III family protein [Auriscalpium vulgare]|uniref:Heparinase II/III family protein n=1 Tax=Auriscalpium vulgare TaxID=40419 RepID=A0ACB8RW44_9AGAM|nr:heparinase II/III family protein [Auriscalpium vulgare]
MASYNPLVENRQGQSPYGSADPYYHESTGYITPSRPAKRGISKWIKFGLPILILVIAGAVVGGVVGSHHSGSKSSSSSAAGSTPGAAEVSSAVSAKNAVGRFATGTNTEFFMPEYPATTNTAAFTSPTFLPASDVAVAWPKDSFAPSSPSATQVRPDRPRLIAPAYKWAALPTLISSDPYLKGWNDTIFGNATAYFSLPPVVYHMDGASGILDNAREIKQRIKAFAYVYRMTNDTKWVDRTWQEVANAAGNGTTTFGPATDRWNTVHFLDTAEFCAAYAIAYDWLYDMWTDDQRAQMRFTMNLYGLGPGLAVYNGDPNGVGWWSKNINGNWNCVCNSGLTMGALAILGDDTTNNAASLLAVTINDAKQNCAQGPSDDGTWSETANYWYFGTTGHAEMTSSLITATGSDFGLLSANANFNLTGLFHMHVTGTTSLFNYGDHGPNKFSTTANSMIFYASQYNAPQYALFQRDQHDAPEPWSMFWYDPTINGAFWDGMPLDHFFDNQLDQWTAMRSSWTDNNALYVAMKAGQLQNHQTHNDLDCGDFVLDALGTRWAGELGSGDYLSQDYFTSDAQNATRWLYYRKRTEGQNTILVNQQNQNVAALPKVTHGTTGDTQGSSTVMTVSGDSTAYWVADLSSAYFNVTSFSRGVRTINARKQVLIQDDINAQGTIMWRMHTNATVTIDSSGTSATLALDGQTMVVQILNAPSGATFTTGPASRLDGDPALPTGQSDQPNPGVTVLIINLPAGTYSLQVLFNPQWSGMQASDFKTPSSVPLSGWSLTSHN